MEDKIKDLIKKYEIMKSNTKEKYNNTDNLYSKGLYGGFEECSDLIIGDLKEILEEVE